MKQTTTDPNDGPGGLAMAARMIAGIIRRKKEASAAQMRAESGTEKEAADGR
jgi:hypothetical protein